MCECIRVISLSVCTNQFKHKISSVRFSVCEMYLIQVLSRLKTEREEKTTIVTATKTNAHAHTHGQWFKSIHFEFALPLANLADLYHLLFHITLLSFFMLLVCLYMWIHLQSYCTLPQKWSNSFHSIQVSIWLRSLNIIRFTFFSHPSAQQHICMLIPVFFFLFRFRQHAN